MTSNSSILISISIALLAGLLLSRLAKKISLPAVTAYLIAGVLIGPFVLGGIGIEGLGISHAQASNLTIISDVALGFIAFSMGNEFRVSQLKKIGKQATIIGIWQAVFTTILVDTFLIGLHFLMPDKLSASAAIVLGAVATATAPAATLMVVKQYKAKGKLTDILLPVVALDDAVGLVLFAISASLFFLLLKSKRFPHTMSIYLITYGIWRFFAEFFRADNRGQTVVEGLTPSQLTAIVLFFAAILLYILLELLYARKNKKQTL
jgi:Kef-type K+ transport system membrane component KefB